MVLGAVCVVGTVQGTERVDTMGEMVGDGVCLDGVYGGTTC